MSRPDARDPFTGWSDDQPQPSLPASPAARLAAHQAFDQLWQPARTVSDPQTLISRSRAYHLVAIELGIPEAEVHLSVATEEVARAIPQAVEAVRDKLAKRTRAQIMQDWRARGREVKAARAAEE